MKNAEFVVFLDVDGVLNSRTTVQRTPEGYQGIDDACVELLSNVIRRMGGGDIVLTSDWKEMKATQEDYLYLISKLEKYGMHISAKTEDQKHNRAEGIIHYLEAHPEIREYVILDDCRFDFADYKKIWERLLLTNGIEHAEPASKTPTVEALLFMDYLNEG